jgi:hypothetical protein
VVDPSGVRVTGLGKDGRPREVHLYHLADNAWTMAEFLDLEHGHGQSIGLQERLP